MLDRDKEVVWQKEFIKWKLGFILEIFEEKFFIYLTRCHILNHRILMWFLEDLIIREDVNKYKFS